MSDLTAVLDGRSVALVIVECQNGVVGHESVLPALAEEVQPVLPVIGRLANGARSAGATVVHLTYVPALGNRSSNRKPTMFGRVLALMDDWTPGHPATQVVDEIGVGPGDLVLPRHSGLSPSHSTELFAVLRNAGIDTVVLAGVSLNIAIPVVAAELTDEGFSVVIARDAVAGTPADYGEAVLRNTLAFIATLTTVDELLDRWAQPPVDG